MGIGRINTEGELEAFIRQRLQVPDNLPGMLVGYFLKLATEQDARVAWGQSDVSFTAALGAEQTITHSLGRQPVVVVTSPFNSSDYLAYTKTYDATNFLLGVRNVDGSVATGTVTCTWVAIG